MDGQSFTSVKMKSDRISLAPFRKVLLQIVSYLNFAGFYTILMCLIAAGMLGFTEIVTIPLRAVAAGSFLLFFFLSKKRRLTTAYAAFYVYALIYLARLSYDSIHGRLDFYYMSGGEILLFFFFFVIFPFFILTRLQLDEKDYKIIFNAILFSTFTFVLTAFYFYRDYIGQVGILVSSTADEDVLSHLALAYSSGLGISLSGIYLITARPNKWFKVYLILIMALGLILFFLAAGRGATLAIAVVVLCYFAAQKNIKAKLRALLAFVLFGFIAVWLLETSGSALLNRFDRLFEASGAINQQDARMMLWTQGWEQFTSNPILGSGIALDGYGSYVHNIFLEVLYTTGIVGFIPFIVILFKAFRKTFNIFRHHTKYSWIPVLFIMGFMEHVVSGAIYTGMWMWFGMGLVFSFEDGPESR